MLQTRPTSASNTASAWFSGVARTCSRPLAQAFIVVAHFFFVLVGSAVAAPTAAAPAVVPTEVPVARVVAHGYTLDPAGTLELDAVAAQPARFSPLPTWWHRDPPGVVRWEQLDLRWREATRGVGADATLPTDMASVLQLRTTPEGPATVSYAPDDPLCGHVPPHLTKESTAIHTVGRWTTLPLCPGARAVFLRFTTSRNVGPLVKVRSGPEAAVTGFTSAANAYIVAMMTILGILFGLVGTLRNRDPFWAGLLIRNLLFAPNLFHHAAAPPNTAAAVFVRLFTGPAPDVLLATTVLGHGVFLVCLLWTQTPAGWGRRALVGIPVSALLAVLTTVAAPYPLGFDAALGVAALSLPVALGVTYFSTIGSPGNATTLHARGQQAALFAVVLFGTLNPLLLFNPERWRASHICLLLLNLGLIAWLVLRAGNRREAAATALLEAKWSRERADERAREHEARRLETRDLMLMLTHEIRTPLAVLQLSVDNAAKSPLARMRVHEAIAEMDRLIERCLETARIDTEAAEDAIGTWAASLSVQMVIARSRTPERLKTTGAADTDVHDTRPVVIDAILAILVDNALRYGSAETDVELNVSHSPRERPGVAINVVNAVGPLGPPDAARVFQKYYRGAGAHRQSGAGLGLYLASRLADRLGGELTHASTMEYTRFTLWIPR